MVGASAPPRGSPAGYSDTPRACRWGGAAPEEVSTGRGARVTAVTATKREKHADLEGVKKVLVRPDGHIAWAARTADTEDRRRERRAALSAWAGAAS